jgi:nucleoside-diphosphate-sugar epimerase
MEKIIDRPRKKVLVLGNLGYLGRHIQEHLEKTPDLSVRGFEPKGLEESPQEALHWCDYCILCLGLSDHNLGRQDPFLDYDRNLADYLEVLRLPESRGKKFIYLGSLCQYGVPQGVVTETTPFNPVEPQGLNKAYIEKILEFMAPLNLGSFCALRLGAVVGGKKDLSNLALLEKIILTNLEGNLFEVYGGVDRSYACIPLDTFLLVITAILKRDHFRNRAYNLSTHNLSFGSLSALLDIKFNDSAKLESHAVNSDKLFTELDLKIDLVEAKQLISNLRYEISKLQNLR